VLSGFELASERMSVALDSGDQEDEQSCFSDNTKADFVNDQQGIANIWFGVSGDEKFAGLQGLASRVDPELEKKLTARINETTAAIQAISGPIDRLLATPRGSPQRAKMEKAVLLLAEHADLFQSLGKKLGLKIDVSSE
jgi:putative iron-regulated protein